MTAGSRGGAGTPRTGTVIVNVDGALTRRTPGPAFFPGDPASSRRLVSRISQRMDFEGLGSQMVSLFHKQRFPRIVHKRLTDSQQTPHVGLPFGGVLDFSSFPPLMGG